MMVAHGSVQREPCGVGGCAWVQRKSPDGEGQREGNVPVVMLPSQEQRGIPGSGVES